MRNWYRKRKKAPRRKARVKAEGWKATELGAKVGVTGRTVRFYVAEGVLPAPTFRGASTRYGREHLVWLAAIRFLQREQGLSLPSIRGHLQSVSAAEVERLGAQFLPELLTPAGAAPAAGAAAAGTAGAPAEVAAPAYVPLVARVNDAWHRLTVVPGLEVHCHAAASADVQALARTVVERILSGGA